MDFLQSVAHYFLQHEESHDWSKTHFIFPSHRAGLFFRDALRKELGNRIIFGLNVSTISDFVSTRANLVVADRLTLIFELYSVYKDIFANVKGANTEFEFFFSWAPTFISDFSDVDKYMVDARQIFTNACNYENLGDDLSHLSENQRKAIEQFWNVFFEKKDDDSGESYRQRFTATYEHLFELYETYRNRLRLKGMAYDGMIYREVAEAFSDRTFETDGDMFVFVGFNAVSESEHIIMKRLMDAGCAKFFWDYTPEMLEQIEENDEHGAGRFMRKLIVDFPAPRDYTIPHLAEEQTLTQTAFAYAQSQVSGIKDFIEKYYSNTSAERTAIVLSDENMLLPVVSSLPEQVEHANITMGYPLKQTQLYGLIDLLARLQSPSSATGSTFYGRHVLAILQHACVASPESQKLVEEIIKRKSIRIKETDLHTAPILKAIFHKVEVAQVPEYLRTIFELIYERYGGDNGDELLRECSFEMLKVVSRFKEFMKTAADQIADIKLVFRIFGMLARTQTVDFKGEPLGGLQIMGILETRALDFDNIVLLDVNEGILPKANNTNSFIPLILRRGFGMPTYAFHDSMIAYYFFRLISRAKHVDFLYSTAGGDDKVKSISRFLLQLKYQYQRPIAQRVATHTLNIYPENTRTITKTPAMLQKLHERLSGNHKLSPTTLTNYLACPATLYYSKVVGLADADELVEDIDNRTFGNIFHAVMERLFNSGNNGRGFLLSKENKEAIAKSDQAIHTLLCQAYNKEFGLDIHSKDDLDGQNYLTYDVLFGFIKKAVEVMPTDSLVIHCELKTNVPYHVKDGIDINLGGTVDCIYKDPAGNMCVLDYKTGKVEDKLYKFSSVDNLFKDDELKPLTQTLYYSYVLKQMGIANDFYPRIMKVQYLNTNSFTMAVKVSSKEAGSADLSYSMVANPFEERLHQTIEEMFDIDTPFEPNTETNHCKYCDFSMLCKYSTRELN